MNRGDLTVAFVTVASIYIKYEDVTYEKIVGGGVRGSAIIRGRDGPLLKSHTPLMLIKPGSFWEYEESQTYNSSCIGNSKYLPGCFNSPDRHDNSSLTLVFPVGLASPPHGCYIVNQLVILFCMILFCMMTSTFIAVLIYVLNVLLARQLSFSIDTNAYLSALLHRLIGEQWRRMISVNLE